MKILIFGGTGMLGHTLLKTLSSGHEVTATVRNKLASPASLASHNIVEFNHFLDQSKVSSLIKSINPQVIVNCIGIVKKNVVDASPIEPIQINSLFPHLLAKVAGENQARLIHLSTDCVFSGAKGKYLESDLPDPIDLYGRSKLLGEVAGPNCLTLRTSMIGFELGRQHGLLEWLLSQKNQPIEGYSQAIFSGLTTHHLSLIIANIIENFPTLQGLYHVSATPISKLALVELINRVFVLNCAISPVDQPKLDRSLNSDRFWSAMSSRASTWEQMIADLFKEYQTERLHV